MNNNNINNGLEKLQNVLLEILDDFVRICNENNFTYFLVAGTLLGAVRHKGFIPWDDDIDVAMSRKDYEKFLDYCENNKEMNYYILSNRCPVNTHYHYISYAKFCKKNTLFAEGTREEKDYSGIFIDIWPYDNCNLFFLPLQKLLILISKYMYKIKTYNFIPKNKIKLFLYKYLPPLIPSFIIKFYQKYSDKFYIYFNKYNVKYLSFFSGLKGFIKETQKYNEIFPLSNILFEGKYYNAPADVDAYLKKMYGNYMKIPKLENRKFHNKYIVFNTSEKGEISNENTQDV